MRRVALLAFSALMLAVPFAAGPASAIPLAAPAGLAAADAQTGMAENVALVCRRAWNGYRWVRRCYNTGPVYRYSAPPMYQYYYPAPRMYYRPWRPWRYHYF